jgi:hypothetical protein
MGKWDEFVFVSLGVGGFAKLMVTWAGGVSEWVRKKEVTRVEIPWQRI